MLVKHYWVYILKNKQKTLVKIEVLEFSLASVFQIPQWLDNAKWNPF